MPDKSKSSPLITSQAELFSKLRAVEFEIEAVASTIERSGDEGFNGNGSIEQGDTYDGLETVAQPPPNDSTLQHALAADRLESLKKTKARLEEELSNLCKVDILNVIDHHKEIRNLVKEEKPKRRSNLGLVEKSNKKPQKRQKRVAFDDDVGFDAALDAASAGFVETVSGTKFPSTTQFVKRRVIAFIVLST